MPIYEYYCSICNNNFELKQGFDANTVQPCPDCESVSRRNFNVPTVIYKGSGFYTTDYARKDSQTNNENSNANTKNETSTQKSDNGSKSNAKE